jgi:hypothetical protein
MKHMHAVFSFLNSDAYSQLLLKSFKIIRIDCSSSSNHMLSFGSCILLLSLHILLGVSLFCIPIVWSRVNMGSWSMLTTCSLKEDGGTVSELLVNGISAASCGCLIWWSALVFHLNLTKDFEFSAFLFKLRTCLDELLQQSDPTPWKEEPVSPKEKRHRGCCCNPDSE